ncbi:MAG: DsbC family protein [Azoarcus sp.]|jgi:thiol:disulfide interchange protein DsbC|nr:DsbC family protein [Azoarcus sp.]
MTSTTERWQKPFIILALLAGGISAAHAAAKQPVPQTQRLRAALEKAHPGTRFTDIQPSPIAGLYEVWMDGNIAYVFAQAPRYFLFGHIFDVGKMTDLTAARLAERFDAAKLESGPGPIAFEQLPLKDALKTVRGNGKRHLAVFSDPACPYCRQIETELAGLDDVTIFTFIVPFKGDARPLSIWCAEDRAAAWNEFMLRGDERHLATGEPCPNPIARNLELARTLAIPGTPTLIWADGSRTEGVIDQAAIEARLARIAGGVKP